MYKEVFGFENYIINNEGNVINKDTGKIKSHNNNTKGYLFVSLYKENKVKQLYVHRLVALYFIPNPNNFETVNHIDGNKENNHVQNLEWCTLTDNIRHAFRTGLNKKPDSCKKQVGERFSKTVINLQTGIFYASVREAAETYHIKYFTLSDKLRNPQRNNTPFIYA